jgi:hypothetical protein
MTPRADDVPRRLLVNQPPGVRGFRAGDKQDLLNARGEGQSGLHSPLDRKEGRQIGQPPLGNGQVRNDVGIGTAVRRMLRKSSPHRRSQLSERLNRLRI